MSEKKKVNWSLVVSLSGLLLSAGVALVTAAIWLGSLSERVNTLLEQNTEEVVANALDTIRQTAVEVANDLDEILSSAMILPVYSIPNTMPTGWVRCGEEGTPSLTGRFLLGTTDSEQLGESTGSPDHSHGIELTDKGESFGEHRSSSEGPDYADNLTGISVNIPGGRVTTGSRNWYHEHILQGQTGRDSNLPPSVKVMFLCRIP